MKQLIFITILAMFFLFSCGGNENKSDENVKIEKASQEQIEGIKYGLKDKSLSIVESCTVKSDDFKEVYFVGAKLSNGKIGVWAVGGTKTETNMHFSVNDVAEMYSDFPRNPQRATMYDHGAQEVFDYLNEKTEGAE